MRLVGPGEKGEVKAACSQDRGGTQRAGWQVLPGPIPHGPVRGGVARGRPPGCHEPCLSGDSEPHDASALGTGSLGWWRERPCWGS